MRPYIIFIFSIIFVSSCISDTKTTPVHKTCVINTAVITSDIDGIDSLMVVKADNTDLFKIALGGNTELLSDTVICIDNNNINLITLADYFQDNQIFYVLFNPSDYTTYQTEKLYLPYVEMEISEYNQLDSISMTSDSLYMTSKKCPEVCCSLRLDSIQCDENGILNFYEFE